MTDPTSRNRLDDEESPYLRQHADNPVAWQPWDGAAFEAARERDVPVFLSIGYSACHWCHVMAEESFEDEATAARLNDSFVPIKLDREERPDVDSVYMTICQLVNGSGGWPLSAFLTPDGKPFYVGTYFPPEPRQGMPGFRELLADIADSWADPDQRQEIENRADQWTSALVDRLESTPDEPGEPPDEAVLEDAVVSALNSLDREYGGFGPDGPKFPQPTRLELLLSAHARSGRQDALRAATRTLDAMADGGMYDHVGGGFHRYATDRQWRVPHFEKMLYDNGELPRVYLDAARATGDDRYATVARETLAFVDRELSHPDGGFYSTLDARSPVPGENGADDGDAHDGAHGGEEGLFYTWTPEEVHEAVGDADRADLFCDRFGVTDRGNFEGRSVLRLAASLEDLAEDRGRSLEAVRGDLAAASEAVFEARETRPRPARDEKVLSGWNGLAVSAFAAAALALEDHEPYAERAREALSFARRELWDADERRLARRYKDGDLLRPGFLEDYAMLGRGAFDTYQATGDVDALAFALALAEVVVEEFYDADAGTLYSTPESGESLVARPQELGDQSTASSIGVAVRLLGHLDGFAPDEGFGDVADDVLGTHGDRMRASPIEHGSLTLAAAERAGAGLELTFAADELPGAWRETLADRYLPGAVLAPRPPTAAGLDRWLETLGLAEAPPVWADRDARDGPTVYACRDFTCSPPQGSLAAALEWFDGDGGDPDLENPTFGDSDGVSERRT